MPLTQIQEDLKNYAEGKLFSMIKDVTQAFDIAEQKPAKVLVCLLATFMKASALIAASMHMPREEFQGACLKLYDREANDVNEYEDKQRRQES